MASLYVLWNRRLRVVEGTYDSSTDANNALRKHLSKSGTKINDKGSAAASGDYEVLTTTRVP